MRAPAVFGALVAAVALGASACSASQGAVATKTSSSSTSSLPASTLPSSTPTLAVTPTTISPPAHVGGAVFLPGVNDVPPARVTLVKVIDPAQGADQFATPVAGGKFVGVQLRITFGGDGPVFVDVAGDTILDDSSGDPYQPTEANIQNCPAFNLGPSVSPGATVLGCLTFQIADDTKASEITFTPNGQFGEVSAEWQIP